MPDDIQAEALNAASPYKTLDTVAKAGVVLVAVAMERLREAEEALLQGRFDDAYDRSQELVAKIAPLAHAETHIGALDGAKVVRAGDIEVGMVVLQRGEVIDRETNDEACQSGQHQHRIVSFTFDGGGTMRVTSDTEIAVQG